MRHTFRRWAVLVEMQVKLLPRGRLALAGAPGLAVASLLVLGAVLGGAGARALPACVVAADGAPAIAAVAASGDERCPTGRIAQLTPDLVGLLVLWGNLTAGATVVAWRERGTLRHLSMTPLRPVTLIATQVATRLVCSCLQVALLLALARGIFGVRPPDSPRALGLILIVATLTILALGFVIGALAPTAERARAVATLVAIPMLFLSGASFALDDAPAALRSLAGALPPTVTSRALRQVMLHGAGPGAIQQDLLALLAWLIAALLIAARAFRWDGEAR